MITISDIALILQELSDERPLYHSEADFQHALAWRIHQRFSDARVRLEVNPYKDGQRAYLDILLHFGDVPVAIELKYKTRKMDFSYGNEDFHLLDQSAQDTGRYDFIKDVCRLERFVTANPDALGIAVFLSNDPSYWTAGKRDDTVDGQFRIHESNILKGTFRWGELASAGTRRGRDIELELSNEYPLIWQDYSVVNDSKSGQFKYLLLDIHKPVVS